MLVYLAGPIDDVDEEGRWAWADTITEALPESVQVFSPYKAFRQNPTAVFANPYVMHQINKYAIQQSDCLIAYLAGKGRGFGTIREIEYARECDKPVFVVGELVSAMAYDVTMVHPGLKGHRNTWEELLKAISSCGHLSLPLPNR